jgi:hypothetical protein
MNPGASVENKALVGISPGALTPEVALKLIEGLKPEYRENPQMIAAMIGLFGRAAVATPPEMQVLLGNVANAQYRIDNAKK